MDEDAQTAAAAVTVRLRPAFDFAAIALFSVYVAMWRLAVAGERRLLGLATKLMQQPQELNQNLSHQTQDVPKGAEDTAQR